MGTDAGSLAATKKLDQLVQEELNRALQEAMNVYRVSYLLDCYGDRGERDASL